MYSTLWNRCVFKQVSSRVINKHPVRNKRKTQRDGEKEDETNEDKIDFWLNSFTTFCQNITINVSFHLWSSDLKFTFL